MPENNDNRMSERGFQLKVVTRSIIGFVVLMVVATGSCAVSNTVSTRQYEAETKRAVEMRKAEIAGFSGNQR